MRIIQHNIMDNSIGDNNSDLLPVFWFLEKHQIRTIKIQGKNKYYFYAQDIFDALEMPFNGIRSIINIPIKMRHILYKDTKDSKGTACLSSEGVIKVITLCSVSKKFVLLKWFEDVVLNDLEEGQKEKKLVHRRILVTPEQAKKWLQENTRNRQLSGRIVHKYAAMMKAGEWLTTHEGIALYQDGKLADGQHRLAAIIEANCAIELNVTFGLSLNAGLMIDNNKPRQVIDRYNIGYNDTWLHRDKLAVLNFLFKIKNPTPNTIPFNILPDIVNNPLVREKVDFAFACLKENSTLKKITTAGVYAAIATAYGIEDSAKLLEFGLILRDGDNRGENGKKIIKLRDLLISRTSAPHARLVYFADLFYRTQKTIQRFCNGSFGSQLSSSKEGNLYPNFIDSLIIQMRQNDPTNSTKN